MKLLIIFLVIFVVSAHAGVGQQQRSSNLVRLAYPTQQEAQQRTQSVQYTAQSQNSAAHEAYAHQQHAQFVASQQQQKLAKQAFGQSQPPQLVTHQTQGAYKIAQSISGPSPPQPQPQPQQQQHIQTTYKFILPTQQQLQPQAVRTISTSHPQSIGHTQYAPVKVIHHHHNVPAPQAVRYAPLPQTPAHQYPPQPAQPLLLAPQPQSFQQQQQQIRYIPPVTSARVTPIAIPQQAPVRAYAPQLPPPQRYIHSIPSAAIRNVDSVAVQKTITPVVTKSSQSQIHSEPAISVGNVQGFSQTSQGPGKIAEVVYNTRYTSYATPSVGLHGPVTFAGPVEQMGANAGANAIIALLSGQASGQSQGHPGVHTVAPSQFISHQQQQPGGPPPGIPSAPLYAQQPQIPPQGQPQGQLFQYVQSPPPEQQAPIQFQPQPQSPPPQPQFYQQQFQQPQPIPQPIPASQLAETPTAPTPSLFAVQQQQPQYSVPIQVLGQPEGAGHHSGNHYQFQDVHGQHQGLSQQPSSAELNHQFQQLQASSVGDPIGNSLQELTTDARGSYNFQNL